MHAVQLCGSTHALRIIRHKTLMGSLKEVAKRKGFVVTQEPHLRHEERVLKPDLILRRRHRIAIVDTAVPWDTPERYAASRLHKRAKYSALIAQQRKGDPGYAITVDAFIVGARGRWDPKNDKLLKLLGIKLSEGQKEAMCTLMVKLTGRITDHFLTSAC
ncbi:reverse transcriptase [Trichuris trichiura]|uniref:Reverse transcriptase n=1 Tax=Trichuris trichiura TaxID=36087 RepID=A0A077ZQA2_TRITR|nr:reverse transcriptase [Trichuris trichiura]